MKRIWLASILVGLLSAPAAFGQAKMLPPVVKREVVTTEPPSQIMTPQKGATIGLPLSLPPADALLLDPPQRALPHQMAGREPAHGTKTAGVLKGPPIVPPVQVTVIPPPEISGPVERIWAELDYLIWWVHGDRLPSLVTTSPSGTAQGLAGVLGEAGTTILAGGEFNRGARSGLRLNIGYWFDSLQTWGLQAGGFWLANGSESSTFTSTGDPILARPFVDATTNLQAAKLVAFPGFSSGSIVVGSSSSFNGWDIALRQQAGCFRNGRVDAILGYRQLRLTDSLSIVEDVTSLGSTLVATDRFDTENEFHGAEFGFVGEWRHHNWVFAGLAKVAAGWNASRVAINGSTLINGTESSGGFLALPSNIGFYRHNAGMLIPEVGLNVACDVNCHLRVRGGYTFLYWDQVYRPGQQIDTGIDPSLLPPGLGGGLARPAAIRQETELFVHGLNFGVEVRY